MCKADHQFHASLTVQSIYSIDPVDITAAQSLVRKLRPLDWLAFAKLTMLFDNVHERQCARAGL